MGEQCIQSSAMIEVHQQYATVLSDRPLHRWTTWKMRLPLV